MPSKVNNYNVIMKKCEKLNLDSGGNVIDGVKISTEKYSVLYEI